MATYTELALAFASIPSSPVGVLDYDDIPILSREDDSDLSSPPSLTRRIGSSVSSSCPSSPNEEVGNLKMETGLWGKNQVGRTAIQMQKDSGRPDERIWHDQA